MSSHKNAISWFEIPVVNMDRARKFYETILNIKLSELTINETFKMALFPQSGEDSVGGALVMNQEWYFPTNSGGPVLYLNANPDLKVVEDRIEPAGGTLIISKRTIGDDGDGCMAVFEDTEGNRMALYSDS